MKAYTTQEDAFYSKFTIEFSTQQEYDELHEALYYAQRALSIKTDRINKTRLRNFDKLLSEVVRRGRTAEDEFKLLDTYRDEEK